MKYKSFYIFMISLHTLIQPSEQSAFQEEEIVTVITTSKQKKRRTKKSIKAATAKNQKINLASLYQEETNPSDPYKNFAILLNKEEDTEEDKEESSCEPCRESRSPQQNFDLDEQTSIFQEEDPLNTSISLEEVCIQYQPPIINSQPITPQKDHSYVEDVSPQAKQKEIMQSHNPRPIQPIINNSAKRVAKSNSSQALGNSLPKNNVPNHPAKAKKDGKMDGIMDDVEECGCSLFECFLN